MANTPYIDLVKPAGTDKALISVLNANSDKIDSAVGGVQDALAIVCNGNTHGAITSGQFVYVRAHDTLQEGLYTANSNIAANATLSSSNLTANSSGGLNALNEHMGGFKFIDGGMNPSDWNDAYPSTSNTIAMYQIINSNPTGSPTIMYSVYGILISITLDASSGHEFTRKQFYFPDGAYSSGFFVRTYQQDWLHVAGDTVTAKT